VSAMTHNTNLLIVCGIVFLSILVVALLVLSVPARYAARNKHQARLDEISSYRMIAAIGKESTIAPVDAPTTSTLTTSALQAMDKRLRSRGTRGDVITELEMTGIRLRPEEWATIKLATIIGSAVIVAFLISNIFGILLGGAAAWGGLRLFVRFKINRRRAAFDAQLPDALQLIAGALRSGFALNQSIAGLVKEGTEPVASEFGRALSEVRLGADLEVALDGIATRMQSYEMVLVCMAIRTSREVGGNLAEILQNTVETMRERAHLKGQVKTLTAEGRMSAKVLIAMPFGIALYMSAVQPGYLKPMFHSFLGIVMLVFGAILLSVGAFWMNRLVKIEV
jgi:tight adherence protein B